MHASQSCSTPSRPFSSQLTESGARTVVCRLWWTSRVGRPSTAGRGARQGAATGTVPASPSPTCPATRRHIPVSPWQTLSCTAFTRPLPGSWGCFGLLRVQGAAARLEARPLAIPEQFRLRCTPQGSCRCIRHTFHLALNLSMLLPQVAQSRCRHAEFTCAEQCAQSFQNAVSANQQVRHTYSSHCAATFGGRTRWQ